MKNILNYTLLLSLSISSVQCNSHNDTNETPNIPQQTDEKQYTIEVIYEYGENGPSSSYKNIYVVWVENKSSNFIQNLLICQKLIKGGLTNTALPFWKLNTYPSSSSTEVDAVTSATIANQNVTTSSVLKDSTVREFEVFFEIDRSFEPNDWFSDQPALLYSASINLDNLQNEYQLQLTGWTPNEGTQNKIPNTPSGELQNEIRYITQLKNGDGFGDFDDRASSKMVKSITAKITAPVSTSTKQLNNNSSFSVYPNPAKGEIHIKSTSKIQELAIQNIQSQTLLHTKHNNTEVHVLLDKNDFPSGSYFIRVTDIDELSSQQILVIE